MIDSVVGLVEEHVGSGGSQFLKSILERWRHAIASQQNVVVLEFWSPGPTQFLHELTHCRCWASSSHDVLQVMLVVRFHVYQVALIDREFAQLGFLHTDLCEL